MDIKAFQLNLAKLVNFDRRGTTPQETEGQVLACIAAFLTAGGLAPERIKERQMELLRLVNDQTNLLDVWLPCRYAGLVKQVATQLLNPSKLQLSDVRSLDDLEVCIKGHRESAETLTQQALLDSALSLIARYREFGTMTSGWGPAAAEYFIRGLPWCASAWCVGLFAPEIALLMSTCSMVYGAGKLAIAAGDTFAPELGAQLERVGLGCMQSAGAVVCRLTELNVCLGQYSVWSTQRVSALVSDLLTGRTVLPSLPEEWLGGGDYRTADLKRIAVPLEWYVEQQSKQIGAWLRTGHGKSKAMSVALNHFQMVDKRDIKPDEKLSICGEVLEGLEVNPKINCKMAHLALEAARQAHSSLTGSSERQSCIAVASC